MYPTPEALMRTVAAAFAKGDLQPLFGIVDDRTVWKTASIEPGKFRFGGSYEKRTGVVEVTALLATTYQIRRFKEREIVSAGEVAWGLFEMEAQYRPTGRTLVFDVAIRWRVREGKLLEHQGFFDTAAVLAMQQDKGPQ